MVPNMDHGSSGCQNAAGIGPRGTSGDTSDPVYPAVNGLAPADAGARAAALGHTVVFHVDIPDYGECWCQPPPEGKVVGSWWNGNGALFLDVAGVDEGHTADQQPAAGWGC